MRGNMKKLLLGLLSCAVFFSPAFASHVSLDRLYRGEFGDGGVASSMRKGIILPVYLNEDNSFRSQEGKQKAITAALEQIKSSNGDYVSHYNAAVVYAASFRYSDYGSTHRTNEEAMAAISHATAALNKKSDEPYMYLVRGEMRYTQAIKTIPSEGSILNNKKMAQGALADFETLAKMSPLLAPFDSMATLASHLNLSDKKTLYRHLAELAHDRTVNPGSVYMRLARGEKYYKGAVSEYPSVGGPQLDNSNMAEKALDDFRIAAVDKWLWVPYEKMRLLAVFTFDPLDSSYSEKAKEQKAAIKEIEDAFRD